MGMTIDERIAQLVRVKHYASPRHYETLDVAIDTMRKYQQIIDAMLMNDMVENIYFAIEEILKDDLEQDERFGK